MIEKARKLLKSGRVESLGEGRFNVIGDHGTYIVVQSLIGRVTCNCPGFLRMEKCSHSAAVMMLIQGSKRPRLKIGKG